MIKRITLLDFGLLAGDLGWFLPNPSVYNEKDTPRPRDWVTVPAIGALIEHRDGIILFDTGPSPDAKKVWPQQLFQLFPLLKFSEENRLENQLKELGLKVSDIDYVVFSHLHLDHTGQAYMFKDTKAQVITHVKELDFALRMIWLGKGGVYLPSDLEALKGGNWFPINTDHFELLPGVNIYWVGGHTPGSIMLSVESEKGNVILTGDFIHVPEELNVEMKGWLLGDLDEYLNGMKRLKLMMRRPNTKLVISHDPKIWEKYPKAPTPLIS